MAYLAVRGNPFDQLFDFRRDFDGMFNRLLTGRAAPGSKEAEIFIPALDAWIDNKAKSYHLRVALPGIEPEEVQVTLEGNNLTISGEHKTTEEKKNADYQYREFSYGRFERVVTLPEQVDAEKLAAEYKNGVLEISAPISASAQPKKIEIKASQKSAAAGA